MTLEKSLRESADIVGPCPLPDPDTHGTKTIHQPTLVRIEKQPPNYYYDIADNTAEKEDFIQRLQESVLSGEITEEDAQKILEQLTDYLSF